MPREAPRPPALETKTRGSISVRALYYGLPWSLSLPKRLDAHNSCRSQDCHPHLLLTRTRFLAHIIRYSSYRSLDALIQDSFTRYQSIVHYKQIFGSGISARGPQSSASFMLRCMAQKLHCSHFRARQSVIMSCNYYRSLQPILSRNLNEALS